jgi:hypothetical protein
MEPTNHYRKFFATMLLSSIFFGGFAQQPVLTADTALPIPTINFDANGNLVVKASPASSQHDFDFLAGKWKMHNRKLNKRMVGCKDWTEFESSDENHKILTGVGNVDTYSSTELPGSIGKLFEGFTIRLFNPATRLWSLYWIPSTTGIMDPPVVGSFENNVGHFFGKDTFNGIDIIFVFRWDKRDPSNPVWGQAFSADKGKTWEWNFYNVSTRIK